MSKWGVHLKATSVYIHVLYNFPCQVVCFNFSKDVSVWIFGENWLTRNLSKIYNTVFTFKISLLIYSRENPEYNSIGSSETTVSIRTTVYSGVTTCTLSPPNLSQTTVSMSSNSQPSTTTSSPSTVATPVENQSTAIKASSQTGVNTNVSPFHPAQTAAIIATATATATALTTSKLNSGPPPSPSSDSTPNKPLPQTHRSQSVHTPTMSQLERRMSTPLTPVNPLMAALSVPAQFPDSPHQLSQQQHMMTPVNDPLVQGLPLDMHSQPPPPYNHVAGQRVLQQMPPPYHDLAPLHPGASPMQTGYGTPNKLIPQVMLFH